MKCIYCGKDFSPDLNGGYCSTWCADCSSNPNLEKARDILYGTYKGAPRDSKELDKIYELGTSLQHKLEAN